MKKLIGFVVIALSALILSGCFGGSELIGKWEGEKVMGIPMGSFEFKSSSIASRGPGGDSEMEVDSYVSDKGRLGFVVKQNGTKVTTWFDVIDKDTISTQMGIIKVVYHRVK